MIQKIVNNLNAMNNFSKNIIKYGCLFSFLMCLAGIVVIEYNSISINKISTYNVGSTMIYTAIVVFAQVVIGSLVIDFFGKLISNNE